MMKSSRRILVIGGLSAGPSAASKAVRINPRAEVVLFEQGEFVSYGICESPYYIAGEVPENGLLPYTPESLKERKGVDVRILHRVEQIDPADHAILVRNLRTDTVRSEPYDRLIVATGSVPKRLGMSGEQAPNVFQVKALELGMRIDAMIRTERAKRAVIVGGGYIGVEMADALRSRGLDVTLLQKRDLPLPGLGDETRIRVQEELLSHGVHVMPETMVQNFVTGEAGYVTHVVTRSGAIEADLVIVAIGVLPNAGLAGDAGIRLGPNRGIMTDQRQQTSKEHIFAAGDCCEVRNLVNNKRSYIPLATISSKEGWVAGENAAGGKAIFRGAIRAIAVRVFDIEVVHVGLSAQEARKSGFDVVTETVTAWSEVAVMPGSRQVTITTIVDRKSGRLLGADLFGERGAVLRANTLAVAIQQRLTVDDIRQWDLAYSPPFTPLWDPLLVAANATAKKI